MRVAIVYGSETGNTRSGAEIIIRALAAGGHQADGLDVRESSLDALQAALSGEYDLALLGVSTWGAVDEEVQEDFTELYDAMETMDLSGRSVAVFGSGDQGYDAFAKAVDFVETRLREQGAAIVAPGFKFNLEPGPVQAELEAWARQAVAAAQA